MDIKFIPGRGFDSNIYLIIGEKPTLVDAGMGLNHGYVVDNIKKNISPQTIKQIILTHEHIDHSRGVKKLLKETGENTLVLAHDYAAEKLEKHGDRVSEFFGVFMPKIMVDKRLKDGSKIKMGDNEFVVIHTPGHTPGCICLYNEDEKTLFSGDTVFSHGGFGRYDFPGGDPFMLMESLEKLASLDVKDIYPGHGEIVVGSGNQHIALALKNLRSLI